MALRTGTSPAFEQMDDVAVAEKPEVQVEAAPAAQPSTQTSVAAAKPTAVGAATKFKPALVNLENAIDPTNISFGIFPKVTVSTGGFMVDGDQNIGQDIVLEIMSWNKRWVVSPGSNDKEAGELARFSIDGVHVDGEDTLLLDYVRHLKDVMGYDKASVKEYFAVWGELVSDKDGVVAPENRRIVELQCSPKTVGQFQRYQIELGMKVSRGIVKETSIVKCHANVGKQDKNTFGYATFTAG